MGGVAREAHSNLQMIGGRELHYTQALQSIAAFLITLRNIQHSRTVHVHAA